ncbi:MAG TPA: amino acid permease [Allosphingosinicella sp.]|nr:amino acid permease [Allosphingosinicella sp.]
MAGAAPHATIHRRKLGLWMCVALVVGNMIGSGVFLLPRDLAPLGWNSVYGWLVTIAGTLCLVTVLTRLARGRAESCGPFSYPAAAFGEGAGFVVAWSYWISIWVTNATLAVAVVRNLAFLDPGLADPALGASIAIGVVWLFTIVNCLGVRTAGSVQVLTVLLKLLPLAGAILIAFWLLGTGEAALPPHDSVPIDLAGINAAGTFTLFAMLGFESAMAAGERVENADRNVPRATIYGTAITGLIYLFACSAATLLLPAATIAESQAPFALFFGELISPEAGALVALFAAIAALGAINGFVLLQGELPLSLVRSRLLPAWLGKENRREAPYRIHILSSALATILILLNYSRGLADLFQFMVLVTTSVTIIFYVAGALSALKLAATGGIPASRAFVAVALLGLVYALWALYGAGIEASLWSLGMTLVGLPLYLLMRWANRSSRAPAATPAAPRG